MKTKKISGKKFPGIEYDKSLDKYNDVILFPEKLKKANETLKKVGLPGSKKNRK